MAVGSAGVMFGASDTCEGIGDISASITGEGLDQRSYNPIRDDVFGGNELVYAVSEMGVSLTTSALASRALANSTRVTTDGLRAAAKSGLAEETKGTNYAEKSSNKTIVEQPRADFYVKPNGDLVPSTGYRYISREAEYIEELRIGMEIPANPQGTYLSFDKFDTPSPGRLQVPHDASIRASFDTLQMIDDVRIPYGKWGTADSLEPIVRDYKQFGSGGATQVITNSNIVVDELVDLTK